MSEMLVERRVEQPAPYAGTTLGVGDEAEAWLQHQERGQDSSPSLSHHVGSILLPRAVRIQDLPEYPSMQAEYSMGLGSLAVGRQVESLSPAGGEISTIRDSVVQAAHGESVSLAKNVERALAEALTLVGVMEDIELTRDASGDIQQDGQGLYAILRNSIILHPGDHPELHKITLAAAGDLYILNGLDRAGYLDAGYVWVIPRMVPTNTPGSSIRRYGYFENLAVAWNIIWKEGPNTFKMRPLFTAGVDTDPSEEIVARAMTSAELDRLYDERLKNRHDIRTIGAMYKARGLPVPDSVLGFQCGVLIHRSEFSDPDHPEVDIAGPYDDILGPDHSLGDKGPSVDYVADGKRRAEALQDLCAKVPEIIEELVSNRHLLTTDMATTRYLAKLAKRYAVNYLIGRPELLPVLGHAVGRAAYMAILAGESPDKIHEMARANTCGHGVEDDGDCDYLSDMCPICKRAKVYTRVTRTRTGRKLIIGDCGCMKID